MITVPGAGEDMPEMDSPVAKALSIDVAAPKPAAEAPSPIARVLDTSDDEVSRIEVSRQASAQKTPEQAARVLGLEMRTGLPGDFIESDVDAIERAAADKNFSATEFRKSSPKFAAWVSANPNHFAFAKEDLGFFGRVEKAHAAFGEGMKSVPVQEELADLINQDMDGTLPFGGTERIARLEKSLQEASARAAAGDDALAYGARQAGYSARQFGSTIAAAVKGAAAGGLAGAGYGTVVAPGLGTVGGYTAGATAGGLSASWVYSYRMERAFAYQDLKKIVDIDGRPAIDPNTARLVATGVGVINAAIETGSDYMLAKMVPGLGKLFALGKSGVREAVKAALVKPTVRAGVLSGMSKLVTAPGVEALEEISQALIGSAGREAAQTLTPDRVFAPDSAGDDVKAALGQGRDAFIGTALTFGAGAAGANVFVNVRAAQQAERAENFALALGEGAESKAFKALPEKAQEAVRAIIKDGPLKTAYIDAPVWQELFQKAGLDPREAAAEVLGDASAYDAAVAQGQELAVPMENYARKIAVNAELNKVLAQEIRHAPGAMNARESRELFQKIEQEHVDLMKAEDEFKDRERTVEESGAAVREDVVKQLKATGSDDKTARTQAELARGFESLGARAGIDPVELYSRYVFKIRNAEQAAIEDGAAAAAGGETFYQRAKRVVQEALGIAPHPTETPEFQAWFGGSKVVDQNGQPLVLYHGTSDKVSKFKAIGGIAGHFSTAEAANTRLGDRAEDAGRESRRDLLPGSSLIPVFLSIKNPVRMSDVHFDEGFTFARDLQTKGILTEEELLPIVGPGGPRSDAKQVAAMVELLKAKGYDGIVYKNNIEAAGADTYIPFSPEQVKSAIGNSGAFDPKDARILFQRELAYTPYEGLTPEQRAVEEALAARLAQPDAAEAYAALPNTKGGKLLNVDEARYLAPEYAVDKAGRTKHTLSTQKPAGAWVEQRFRELLAEPAQGPVLFMAGGGGSGKTHVSGLFLGDVLENSEIVLDSVFAHFDKAVARIEAALASGRDVRIAYVHREAIVAARGVAGRFDLEGRWVPAQVLAEDHVNAQETIFKLAEKYKGDERVAIQVFNNGALPAEITLDELAAVRYTEGEETAVEAAQRLLPGMQDALQYVEQKAREVQEAAQPRRDEGEVQGPRASAEQVGALGTEDAGAADELSLNQDPGDGVRGRIRFGPNRRVNLDLLKKANLSTFIHELWHFYFEVMADLADELARIPEGERTPGQQGIIDDYATLLAAVGAKSRAAVTDAQHEQIARMGEAYTMRGKAPSAELRRAFARFKVWLTHIYRDIKALAVDLKPEVVKVFDRLLATEDQLNRAEVEQNVSPLFDDPKSLLGEKDAERYLDAVAAARTEAEEELSAKVLADVEREQADWYKTEREKVRREVEAEIDAQPVYKALGALQSRDPDAPQVKLDPDTIDAMWILSDQSKKKLPRGITSKTGGVSPYIVAEMFGFKTGVELLDALAAAEPRRELIERLTDERMAELHGDLTQDAGRMHDEALSAVHNKKRSALLHRELEILADKHMPQFKGLAFKLARRPPTVAAIRAMAEGMVADKQIKAINPVVYQRAEAKASKQAIEAMLKGDFDTAFEAKQREFLNHELYRAAVAAREDIDKALERFKKIGRRDEDLVKSRDIDLVNAARAVLASFGIGKQPKERAVSYLAQMARYDPDMHETVRVLVEQAQGVGSYEDAKYADFVYLKDTVDALWDLSKRTRQIMVDGKLVDRSHVMGELANRIAEIAGEGRRAGYDRAVSTWEKAAIGLMGIRAALRRVESWVDAMDGGDRNGVFRRYFWTPIAEATAAYRVDRRAFLERYLAIVKGVEESLTHAEIAAPELGYTFRDKAELLGAILHSGNESNLSKLLRGRGWGTQTEEGQLDRSRWDAFIARAQATGVLTKADYEYAQGVWDLLEELKPRAQKAHKEMYGYYFGEVSSKEFETPWGKYRGGYVPAVVDPFMAADAAIRDEKEQIEKGNNSFMFPTAGRGFTKGRVERYAAPLMMDVRFIPGHIDKVLRFVNIEPRVKDVARIVMDRNFRKVLDGFDQTVGGDMIVPWLQRAAQQRIDTPSQGWGGRAADTIFRAVRSRVGLNVMFANVANTLQQPFDLARAFVKVNPRYMRSALWRFVRQSSQMATEIAEKSAFMSTRETARVMEVQQAIDDMMLNPSKYENARAFAARHGYFMQASAQNIVDTITWAAAYDKATAEGAAEREAVRFADSVVRETQGSMAAEDVSRFETGTPFQRAFTMFYGYFNMQANLMGTEFQTAIRDMGLKKGAGRLLYVYTFGFMIPALMGEAVVKALSGDKFDDDDDGYLDDVLVFFFGSQARTATAMFPFVGPAIMAGANAWNKKWYDDRISTSPAVSAIESSVSAPHSVYQAYHDKAHAKKAIRDTLTLIGLASGLPVAPLARPLGYLADVNAGKARPTGPIDYARGLMTGKSGRR